jgi:predicted amidohydrolase
MACEAAGRVLQSAEDRNLGPKKTKMDRRNFLKASTATALSMRPATPSMSGERTRSSNGSDTPGGRRTASLRVAAITLRSQPVSPETNLKRMQPWLARARDGGAALACFPEMSVTGYLTGPAIWEVAEPVPGPSTYRLEALAKRFGLRIAAGIAEMDRGIVYDTYVFVGPEGFIGKSRKIDIPPAEVGSWRGGGIPPIIDLGVYIAGVNICFDNFLPESSRLVFLQGGEVLFAPFAWAVGEWGAHPDYVRRNREWKDYARRTFPSRAIDNGIFLIAVNAVGPAPKGEST